jgi:hypothetical protein
VTLEAGMTDPSSQKVSDMLTRRIGASSRYALVSLADADILMIVDCLPNIVGGQQVGIACDTHTSYYPVDSVLLSYDLARHMAVGGASEVVEALFDSFIRETSDEKLAEAAKSFKRYLNSAIANFPHGVN